MKNELTIAQTSPLQTKRAALLIRRSNLIDGFAGAAQNGGKIGRLYREIKTTNEFLETLDEITATVPARSQSDTPRFVVSSYFLHECFKKLTADQSEQFSFITGVELEGTRVLNQLLELEHDKRNLVGVTANAGFTHRLLITLERFKHRLLAHFHSHPGSGAEATKPSGIDERFQTRLERAGHVAIAAIFSRDGFVRFFRIDGEFEVEVFGEGVLRREDNIFKLTNLD